MMEDKRKHTRLDLKLKAEVCLPTGTICTGTTKNISFGGVMILFTDPPETRVGDLCSVLVYLSENQPHRIEFECMVQREDDGALGLQFMEFTNMDLDSYLHFKNLMVLNSPDPEKTMKEMEANPGNFPLLNKEQSFP